MAAIVACLAVVALLNSCKEKPSNSNPNNPNNSGDTISSGVNLTFNLKAGPGTNSLIIQCVPAMPEGKTTKTRYAPDFFIGGVVTRIGAFDFTQTGGDTPSNIMLGFDSNGSGWNNDFTEYMYVIKNTQAGSGHTWIGNAKMKTTVYTDGLNAAFPDVGIKSITIGVNNPVSLSVSN